MNNFVHDKPVDIDFSRVYKNSTSKTTFRALNVWRSTGKAGTQAELLPPHGHKVVTPPLCLEVELSLARPERHSKQTFIHFLFNAERRLGVCRGMRNHGNTFTSRSSRVAAHVAVESAGQGAARNNPGQQTWQTLGVYSGRPDRFSSFPTGADPVCGSSIV